jgi:glycosyltransferase involved in cell wall biosynthesis
MEKKVTRGKVIIVLPAFNASATLEKTFMDIPPGIADQVILVDDGSKDNTVEIATRLGITVIRHEKNKGYGSNQKTCYREALAQGADVIVMLHPDYQYDSRLIPYFLGYIEMGICDHKWRIARYPLFAIRNEEYSDHMSRGSNRVL